MPNSTRHPLPSTLSSASSWPAVHLPRCGIALTPLPFPRNFQDTLLNRLDSCIRKGDGKLALPVGRA